MSETVSTNRVTVGILCIIAILLVPIAINAIWSPGVAAQKGDAVDPDAHQAVTAHLERATAAITAGEFSIANVALGAALKLAPNSASLLEQLMELTIHSAARNPDTLKAAALDDLQYALDVRQAHSTRVHELARAHLQAHRGKVDEAQKAYEALTAANPDYTDAHLALASLHAAVGRKLEALESYEAAVKSAPTNLRAVNNLGVQYMAFDRNEDAIELFKKAIATTDNTASRLNLADALVKLKRGGEAIAHLTNAAQMSPSEPVVFRRLAAVLIQTDKLKDAEAALRRALALAEDTNTRLTLGRLLTNQKRPGEALKQFQAVLERTPNALIAYLDIAKTFEAGGDLEKAKNFYERFVELAANAVGDDELITQTKQHLQELSKERPRPPLREMPPPPAPPMPKKSGAKPG